MNAGNIATISDRIRRLSYQMHGSPDPNGILHPIPDDRSESSAGGVGSAAADIDLEAISKSLDHVNNFSKRRNTDKLPPVLMYEIRATGESSYKSITLRELLNDVNDEANDIDDTAMLEAIIAFNRKLEERTRQDADDTARPKSVAEPPRAPSPATLRRAPSPVSRVLEQRRQSITTTNQGLPGSKAIFESRFNLPGNGSNGNNGTASNYSANTKPEAEEETYDATGGLRLRDLRRLDFQFNPNEERSVLVRRHAVLFAMDPIRAVVMAKRLILIVPDGADSLLSILDKYMKEWVHANTAKEAVTEGKDGHKDTHSVGAGLQAETQQAEKGTQGTKGTHSRAPTPTVGLEALNRKSGAKEELQGTDNSESITVKSKLSSSSITDKPVRQSLSASSLTGLIEKPTTTNKSTMSTLFRKISLISGTQDPATHELLRASYPSKAYVNSKTAQASANDLPFEMHAFEALLTTVMALETQEYNKVNTQVQIILGYFRSGSLLPIEIQEKMRNRKNDLSVMMRRISSARHTINELTEDDEEMALMNLTTLKTKPSLYHYPLVPEILTKHDEMEELLESYLIDFTSLESKIESTRNQIQNAEELLYLRLDTSRNELLIANTVLAILGCCFGLGAYVSGIFGMNLDNTGKLQETPHVFNIVIATSFGGMMIMFAMFVVYFRSNGMFPARIALQQKDEVKLQTQF